VGRRSWRLAIERRSSTNRVGCEAATEAMTPRKHRELVVRPNMREMLNELDDLRLAFNAIASVDALAARIYWLAMPIPTPCHTTR
jgi:hypothetical protein